MLEDAGIKKDFIGEKSSGCGSPELLSGETSRSMFHRMLCTSRSAKDDLAGAKKLEG